MNKTRVPKGDWYWFIFRTKGGGFVVNCKIEEGSSDDNARFDIGNYFIVKEEAESMARKLRAVLAGADVIEVPSDINEQRVKLNDYDSERERDAFNYGFERAVEIFKSKIAK